jgi:hypothetical protein
MVIFHSVFMSVRLNGQNKLYPGELDFNIVQSYLLSSHRHTQVVSAPNKLTPISILLVHPNLTQFSPVLSPNLQVKVMLRVSDNPGQQQPTTNDQIAVSSFMSVDKKKRQITLTEPQLTAPANAQERGPMVSAPKMFAFDSLFTAEDMQVRGHRQIIERLCSRKLYTTGRKFSAP